MKTQTIELTQEEYVELRAPVTRFILANYRWWDWEDVVQDTMISLWKNRHKYDREKCKDASSWAVGFARFVLMNHYRFGRRRINTVPLEIKAETDEPEVVIHFGEDPERLLRTFLSEEDNAVLTCLLAGMFRKDIASTLGYGSTRGVDYCKVRIKETMFDLWPHLRDYTEVSRLPNRNPTVDNSVYSRG